PGRTMGLPRHDHGRVVWVGPSTADIRRLISLSEVHHDETPVRAAVGGGAHRRGRLGPGTGRDACGRSFWRTYGGTTKRPSMRSPVLLPWGSPKWSSPLLSRGRSPALQPRLRLVLLQLRRPVLRVPLPQRDLPRLRGRLRLLRGVPRRLLRRVFARVLRGL